MSTLYQYDDLDTPSQGYIDVMVRRGGYPVLDDISYHPDQRWLKLWFAEPLSSEQETGMVQIVLDAATKGPRFKAQQGYQYQELYASNNGWTTHRVMVSFGRGFSTIPTVEIDPPSTSAATDMQVLEIAQDYFVVGMRAKGRKNISVEFTWEAWG